MSALFVSFWNQIDFIAKYGDVLEVKLRLSWIPFEFFSIENYAIFTLCLRLEMTFEVILTFRCATFTSTAMVSLVDFNDTVLTTSICSAAPDGC